MSPEMKEPSMEKEKTLNTCIICGCLFQHSHKHPHQTCCGSIECQRVLARRRQKRCRQKRNKDAVRRKENSERQHMRYIRRKEHRQSPKPPPPPRPHLTKTTVDDYFAGLIKMFSGSQTSDEVYRIMENCRVAGRYLRL